MADPGSEKAENNERSARGGASLQPDLSSQMLTEVSSVENRLRQHTLELLEPTIRRQGQLEEKLKTAISVTKGVQGEMVGMRKLKDDAEAQSQLIDHFRVELAEWDKERRLSEQQAGNRLSHQETEMNTLRMAIEKRTSDFNGLQRTLKGLGDIVTSAREDTTELRRYSMERLDMNRDKIAKLRDEYESRAIGAENDVHRLQDRQTCADSAINHMQAEIRQMGEKVMHNGRGIAELTRLKASVACFEQLQQEMTAFIQKTNATVKMVTEQFNDVVDDVKAHFDTAATVCSTSTAKQIEDLQFAYKRDIANVEKVRQEMTEFLNSQTQKQKALEKEVREIASSTSVEISEVRSNLDDSMHRQHVEKKICDQEQQHLRTSIKTLKESHEGSGGQAYKTVLQLLIDCQLLSAALDRQDDADRKNIALFGYKEGAEHPLSARGGEGSFLPDIDGVSNASTTATSFCKRSPRKKGASSDHRHRSERSGDASAAAATNSSVAIDKRCLSCSGSSATTLAGFKMACLQYFPSAVEYETTTYTRPELIKRRQDFMDQAREQITTL